MTIDTIAVNHIILKPEEIEECGLMQWLSKRYEGKSITLQFDTTFTIGNIPQPRMWIRESGATP